MYFLHAVSHSGQILTLTPYVAVLHKAVLPPGVGFLHCCVGSKRQCRLVIGLFVARSVGDSVCVCVCVPRGVGGSVVSVWLRCVGNASI